jgi:hypothetical protein
MAETFIMTGFFALILFAIPVFLVSCGQRSRELAVHLPIPVRSIPSNPSNALVVNDSLPEASSLGPNLPVNLCLQPGIRIQYIELRTGRVRFEQTVNLITEITNTPWSSPASGSIGLSDAMLWLGTKSFLAKNIIIPVSIDSVGIIRLYGYLLSPEGKGPTGECSTLSQDGNPAPTYTLWGEVQVSDPSRASVNLPIHVVNSQKSSSNTSATPGDLTYAVPTISGSLILNPPAGDLQCRNVMDKRTCMNKGLMELKMSGYFTNDPITLTYRSDPGANPVTQEFKVGLSAGSLSVYIPKSQFIEMKYFPSSIDSYAIRMDWGSKTYKIYNPSNDTTVDRAMASLQPGTTNCPPGSHGMRIPTYALTTATQAPECTPGSNNPPTFWIRDLGEGFY